MTDSVIDHNGSIGIQNISETAIIARTTISRNDSGGLTNGNGLVRLSGTLVVANGTTTRNSIGGIGNLLGTVELTGSTIMSNSAMDGGGINNYGDEHLDAHARRHATIRCIHGDRHRASDCHTITIVYPRRYEGDGDAATVHRPPSTTTATSTATPFDASNASSDDQHSFAHARATRGHDPLLCRHGGDGDGAHHPGPAQPYVAPGNGAPDLLRRGRRDDDPPPDGRTAGAQAGRGVGPHRP